MGTYLIPHLKYKIFILKSTLVEYKPKMFSAYIVLLFSVIFILILCEKKFVASFAESDTTEGSDYQHCVCVPFWQCKEDYSGLVEDGIDVMDIR